MNNYFLDLIHKSSELAVNFNKKERSVKQLMGAVPKSHLKCKIPGKIGAYFN